MFYEERLSVLLLMLVLADAAVPQTKPKSPKVTSPNLSCQTFYTLPHRYPAEDDAAHYVPVISPTQPRKSPPPTAKYSKSDRPDFKRIAPPKTWQFEIHGYGACNFDKTKPQPPPWFKVSKIDVKTPNLAVVTVDASGK